MAIKPDTIPRKDPPPGDPLDPANQPKGDPPGAPDPHVPIPGEPTTPPTKSPDPELPE